jgi:hypothetical protein
MGTPDVVGTGVGASSQGQPIIKVYVQRAASRALRSIPSSLDGVPVVIEETGPIVAY